jgi:hypothetical protein
MVLQMQIVQCDTTDCILTVAAQASSLMGAQQGS